MTRSFAAVLLLLAAGSAQAQAPACTYDACALRIRSRFWSGVSVVQGADARRLARIGVFAPSIDLLATANDSAKAHYMTFRSKHNSGAALILVGAVFAGVVGGLAYDQAHYEKNEGLVWGFAAVSVTFTLWGAGKQVSANDHLQQSIWFYNRELGR